MLFRKEKLWLWEKVVAFIEENESRVSVEYKTINGEDFKVWRWNPSSSSEVCVEFFLCVE